MKGAPDLFELKQTQKGFSPNVFRVQVARKIANAETKNNWSVVWFPKHRDTTLTRLGKSFTFQLLVMSEKHPSIFPSTSETLPINILRIERHDWIVNLAWLIFFRWFSDAFVALKRLPRFLLTQFRLKFSSSLLKQLVPVLLVGS